MYLEGCTYRALETRLEARVIDDPATFYDEVGIALQSPVMIASKWRLEISTPLRQ